MEPHSILHTFCFTAGPRYCPWVSCSRRCFSNPGFAGRKVKERCFNIRKSIPVQQRLMHFEDNSGEAPINASASYVGSVFPNRSPASARLLKSVSRPPGKHFTESGDVQTTVTTNLIQGVCVSGFLCSIGPKMANNSCLYSTLLKQLLENTAGDRVAGDGVITGTPPPRATVLSALPHQATPARAC